MKLRSISYYFNEAFLSLFRNRLMAFASVITVASCVFIFAFSYCLAVNIDYVLEQLENSLTINMYLDDEVTEEQVQEMLAEVQAIPNVTNVEYITYDDAYSIFKEDIGDDGEILVGLEDAKVLPRSFIVYLDDAANQDAVVTELEKYVGNGVSEIKYEQQVFDFIETVNRGIRIVSIMIISSLVLISVIIIMNTIKITVNSRRTEITIMKYVGATDWFIRGPFIIEGVLIGLIGALIPTVACWALYTGTVEAIVTNFQMISSIVDFKTGASIFAILLPFSLFMGVAIGVVGSVTAMRKHLNA